MDNLNVTRANGCCVARETFEEEFAEAVKPIIEWMNENLHPHTKVIVEHDGAEVLEGQFTVRITEFLKD